MLSFEPYAYPSEGGAPPLPDNFVPAALPALQAAEGPGGEGGAGLSLIVTRAGEAQIEPIPAARVADPAALRGWLEALRADDPETDVEFGPPAAGGDADGAGHGPVAPEPGAPRPDAAALGAHRTVLGVVDAGIAFWNEVFAPAGAGVFADAGALTLGAGGEGAVRWLGGAALRRIGSGGEGPLRDRAARRTLASAFPRSAFGPHRGARPLLRADALAHGTAMAALALEGQRRAAGPGGPVPMIGLELPREVLSDATGSMLSATLDLAVRALAERARALGAARVVVLAAFAFTGGPQDCEPPALRRLRRTQAHYWDGFRMRLEIVMPVGNHLHDRLHARIEDAPSYGGPQLCWRIVGDDHSFNAMDVVLPDARSLKIEMLPPGALPGTGAVHAFEPDTVHLIRAKGRIVGALWARRLGGCDGRVRVRLALAPTAQAAHLLPRLPRAEPGLWRIGFPGNEALEAWILRDDAPFEDARLAPRRQSWFDDPLYRADDGIGVPAIRDPAAPRGAVRRHGTRAPLVGAPIHDVTARWDGIAGGWDGPAVYAGLGPGGEAGTQAQPVDRPGPNAGIGTVANGTPRVFRVSGTSAAAALQAGRMAVRPPGGASGGGAAPAGA